MPNSRRGGGQCTYRYRSQGKGGRYVLQVVAGPEAFDLARRSPHFMSRTCPLLASGEVPRHDFFCPVEDRAKKANCLAHLLPAVHRQRGLVLVPGGFVAAGYGKAEQTAVLGRIVETGQLTTLGPLVA